VQVLLVAGKAGLARFGTVAIDGTKIAANASVHANRDHDWLAAEVAEILSRGCAATFTRAVSRLSDYLRSRPPSPAIYVHLSKARTPSVTLYSGVRLSAAAVTGIDLSQRCLSSTPAPRPRWRGSRPDQ
jgi:hypothetical protein